MRSVFSLLQKSDKRWLKMRRVSLPMYTAIDKVSSFNFINASSFDFI